jgi:hypothetical protein
MKQLAMRLITTNTKLEKSSEEYFGKSSFIFASILRANSTIHPGMEKGLINLINISKFKYFESLFGLAYMTGDVSKFEKVFSYQ